MPRNKNPRRQHRHPTSQRGGGRNGTVAQTRPLQGIDQRSFVLNDIVPITLGNPANDSAYTVIINADVNGYTWTVQNQAGVVDSAGTSLYGFATDQFSTQAMFYSQYYTKSVSLDLTLTSGGGVYSISPIVSLVNPSGTLPFVFGSGPGSFTSLLSSPQNVEIHQPYTKNTMHVDYSKWLMSMSDRAWRNSIANGPATPSGRELYPTDAVSGGDVQELFKLPSMTRAFQITVPAGKFGAGAGTFVLGLLKFRTNYMFSQRRVNIGDLVAERVLGIRQEERKRAIKIVKNLDKLDQINSEEVNDE